MKQATPTESSGLHESQPPDSEGTTSEPTARKKRRLPLFLKLVITLSVLVGVAAFVVIQGNSNMYWYVTQPIDHDGHRIHILLPVGWTPETDPYFRGRWAKDTINPGQILTIVPNEEKPKITWMQRVMKALHMAPPDESEGLIVLHVGRDETGRWSDPNRKESVETRTIQASGRGIMERGYVVRRAIPIRGTNMEAAVTCISILQNANGQGVKLERSDMANTVCNSMYVK